MTAIRRPYVDAYRLLSLCTPADCRALLESVGALKERCGGRLTAYCEVLGASLGSGYCFRVSV